MSVFELLELRRFDVAESEVRRCFPIYDDDKRNNDCAERKTNANTILQPHVAWPPEPLERIVLRKGTMELLTIKFVAKVSISLGPKLNTLAAGKQLP